MSITKSKRFYLGHCGSKFNRMKHDDTLKYQTPAQRGLHFQNLTSKHQQKGVTGTEQVHNIL